MNFIFKNQKIEYSDSGEGKPILFLHGWGGNKDSFSMLNGFLNKKYRLLSLTFPINLKEVWTLNDYTELVKYFLNKLKLDKVFCVAHSFGARVAINLANENFEKLVLTGAAGIKPRFNFVRFFKILKFKILKKLSKIKLYNSEKLKKYGSSDYLTLNAEMKKTFVNIISTNQKSMLKYINVKTLLFWGKNDTETPVYMAKIFNKKIKNSKLIIKDGDHFAYIKFYKQFSIVIDNFFS